jgi:predicted enzyme related to lactoylglutathione lyase
VWDTLFLDAGFLPASLEKSERFLSDLLDNTRRCVMNLMVNLDVDDLEAAVRFYSAAFGLQVSRHLGAFGVEMLGSSVPIYLLVKSPGTLASVTTSQGRSYERHWTPVHLDFVVDEIEPAVQRALSAGARLEQPIAAYKWGKLALMADPFGHGFCFVQFLGRGYDEIAE